MQERVGRALLYVFCLNHELTGATLVSIFTGAEAVKTEEEAVIFGGTAGESYDPCYHDACDTIENVDLEEMEDNAQGAAHVLWSFASKPVGRGKRRMKTDSEAEGSESVKVSKKSSFFEFSRLFQDGAFDMVEV